MRTWTSVFVSYKSFTARCVSFILAGKLQLTSTFTLLIDIAKLAIHFKVEKKLSIYYMKTRSVLRIKYFSFLFCLTIYNLGFSFRTAFIMKMILNLLEKVAALETKKIMHASQRPTAPRQYVFQNIFTCNLSGLKAALPMPIMKSLMGQSPTRELCILNY